MLRSEGLHCGWVAWGKLLSLCGLHTNVCDMSSMLGSASWDVRMQRRLWAKAPAAHLDDGSPQDLGAVCYPRHPRRHGHAERFDRYYWLSVTRWFSFLKEHWRPRVSTGMGKFLQLGW